MSEVSWMDEAMQIVRRFARAWRLTDDELSDAISYAWEFGRHGRGTPSTVAWYAIKRVRSARRFAGSLPDRPLSISEDSGLLPIFHDADDPARIAGFRMDFESWRERLPDRLRTVVDLLATGETTQETARLTGVSAGRISQLRRELEASWVDHLKD